MDSITAFNASTFRAHTGKPASPAQYIVSISNTPKIMGGLFNEFNLSMAAQTAEIPARQIDVLERRHNGPIRNIPTGHTYSTLNIEYIETSDYNIRNYFNSWQNEMFKENDTWKVPYYKDIISEYLDIELFGPDGRKMSSYRIYEVFPITISSTQLGWAMTNQSMTTNIEFAYHRWEEITFKKSGKGKKMITEDDGFLSNLRKGIKKAATSFGTFVKTVKTIKSNIDFAKKTVKNVRNIAKEIKSLKINTKSLGGFVSSLDNIGNLGSSIDRRINNFGSGVQRTTTRNKETFKDFK